MLKFTKLGAAIATTLSIQLTINLLVLPKENNNQLLQVTRSNLVAKTAQLNGTTAATELVVASSSDTPEVTETVNPTGAIVGLAVVGSAIGIALSSRNTKQSYKLSSNSPQSSLNFKFETEESTIRIEQANRKLQKQLMRLLHDDRNTANRLLSQVKVKNPSRSIDWCVEKVIYDLERDRGSY